MNQDFVDLLRAFGAHDVRFLIVVSLPPRRIDILTALTGLAFADAWTARVHASFGPLTVAFIGRQAFVTNKRATGRVKDLGDVEGMEPSRDD